MNTHARLVFLVICLLPNFSISESILNLNNDQEKETIELFKRFDTKINEFLRQEFSLEKNVYWNSEISCSNNEDSRTYDHVLKLGSNLFFLLNFAGTVF